MFMARLRFKFTTQVVIQLIVLMVFFQCKGVGSFFNPAHAESELNAIVAKSNVVTPLYKIAPGDILSFGINEEPDFEQSNIIVRRDGYATIRPIGEMYVVNQDVQTLTHLLESKLGNYVNHPQVFLNVQQFHMPKIYLFGAVVKPGLYQPLRKTDSGVEKNLNDVSIMGGEGPRLTISNVLSNSGGVTYDANLTDIQILKQNGKALKVNLLDFLLRRDVNQDVLLEEGDTIQVPRLSSYSCGDAEFLALSSAGIYPHQFPVRILGEVEKPGMFYVSTDTPYLNSALALASGFKMNAVNKAVMLTRQNTNNQTYRMVINPQTQDFVLRPNDIIEVKDKHSAKVVRGLEATSRIAQPLVWGLGMWATTLK